MGDDVCQGEIIICSAHCDWLTHAFLQLMKYLNVCVCVFRTTRLNTHTLEHRLTDTNQFCDASRKQCSICSVSCSSSCSVSCSSSGNSKWWCFIAVVGNKQVPQQSSKGHKEILAVETLPTTTTTTTSFVQSPNAPRLNQPPPTLTRQTAKETLWFSKSFYSVWCSAPANQSVKLFSLLTNQAKSHVICCALMDGKVTGRETEVYLTHECVWVRRCVLHQSFFDYYLTTFTMAKPHSQQRA